MPFRELTERYDLSKILHSGRSSTVLKGTERTTGDPVAVKMIPAGPGPLEDAATRFEAFAAGLAVLRHPSLPALLDAGVSADGSAFLVLEPLEGQSLDSAAGRLEPDAAVAFLGQALEGLEALASRGLAHGNLAPDNLFVASTPAGGQVKLLGLGTAAFRGPAAAFPETARFRAPELARGGAATARSDLYSLALVACTVLGATVADEGTLSVQMPFTVTMELANDAALRTILERLLSKEPGERPTFREVRSAFRQALGQASPAPTPITAPAPVVPPISPISPIPAIPAIPAAPPPPAPVAAPPVPKPPPVLPEPEPEYPAGDVLRDIDDELLNALAAPPAAPPPAAAKPAGKSAAIEKPPPDRRRLALIFGALAAALVLVILAGVWLLGRPKEEAAVAPSAPSGPVPPAPPSPQSVMVRLDAALNLAASGHYDEAGATVRSLTAADQSALPPEACARLAGLERLLGLLAVERLPQDLRRGLDTGDLGLLRGAVEAGAGLGSSLPAELQADFGRASGIVELHRQAEADAAAGRHAAVLERMTALVKLAPKTRDPLDLREKAAAALEAEADALAREAHYDEALAKLAPVESTWPGRTGLDARIASFRTAKTDEASQKALLANIPAWERRKKPDEALELLRDVKPTPHLAAQIEAARGRLTALLAQLDQEPPQIELRPGFSQEYSRGNTIELQFRVRDDYKARGLKMWARPPGGKMRQMTLEEHRGYWSIEIPVAFHQNGTVTYYLQATDLSGHEGWLGSPDKPEKLTRIGSDRM